jgi:hypothetical protein
MSNQSTDDDLEELSEGEQWLMLTSIAEAASDLKLAKHDEAFAVMEGGIEKLEAELFRKVSRWESWISAAAPEVV